MLRCDVLRIGPEHRAWLERIVREGYPNETCGLLIGARREADTRVERLTEASNLERERSRDRYELDPGAFVAGDAEARAAGLAVIGVWHSHPDHPAFPSETDRSRAWPGLSYVIVAVTSTGVGAIRSFRLNDDAQFEEEPIRV